MVGAGGADRLEGGFDPCAERDRGRPEVVGEQLGRQARSGRERRVELAQQPPELLLRSREPQAVGLGIHVAGREPVRLRDDHERVRGERRPRLDPLARPGSERQDPVEPGQRGVGALEAHKGAEIVARRLDRLVTNLLDLDRLARGIVTPKLQPTDVGALVRRVVAESDLIADARLRTQIASVTVAVDAAKVERIIENLLANTVRHTPSNSTIWITVRAAPDGVLLLVEDDGPGVAPELTDAIFEPFRQGPDAPQHSPGVGVGLTLVRRFAELHGGRAWVEERAGGGASFRVFLPARPDGSREA